MAINSSGGVELEPYQVILRPLVTEKGTHISEKYNTYTFEVASNADKNDIRHAVEHLWNVRVIKVRTQNRKGKPRKHRFKVGLTPDWKKAIVQLHDEDRIAFF